MPVITELIERAIVFTAEHVPAEIMALVPIVFAILTIMHAAALACGLPNRSWWRGSVRSSALLGVSFTLMSFDEMLLLTGWESVQLVGGIVLLAASVAAATLAVRKVSREVVRDS